MSQENSSPVTGSVLDAPKVGGAGGDDKRFNLEHAAAMLAADRAKRLAEKSRSELEDIKTRQQQVRFLHEALRYINAERSIEDELDWSQDPEKMELLGKMDELGVQVPNKSGKFSAQETRRLIENTKLVLRDLNDQNEIQLKLVNKLQNERYEAWQLARTIAKPLHDAKVNILRNMARS